MIRTVRNFQAARPLFAVATVAIAATSLFAIERDRLAAPQPGSPHMERFETASRSASAVASSVAGPHGKRVLAPTAQVFESSAVAAVRSPDLDGSGRVDGVDRDMLLANWGGTNPIADLDGDGVIDGRDLGLLLAAWSVQ